MRGVQAVLAMMSAWLLAACSSGAVVFLPTPLPPDTSPLTYQHPSRAFSILLPRSWSVYEQGAAFANVAFAPPNGEPLLRVSVVNLGQAIGDPAPYMAQYQTQVRPDVRQYTEQDRIQMSDGSWRITGLRRAGAGLTQQVNTFLQANGTHFAALEAILPDDPALQTALQTALNSFTLAANSDLPAQGLTALTGASEAPLSIINLAGWVARDGAYYLTGEVANRSFSTYAAPPVQALWLDANGTPIAEARSTLMGHGIAANSFAPFGIRFGAGVPVGASSYRLSLGAGQAPSEITLAPDGALVWEDSSELGQDGQLFITGRVSNVSTSPLRDLIATATVFDQAGAVIGAGFTPLEPSPLSAGASAPFTVLVNDLGGRPVNYIVNVQALACDVGC